MKEHRITFSTDLNETLILIICAKDYRGAANKIKKEFPSAFNFR